jgi:hypothetical protein
MVLTNPSTILPYLLLEYIGVGENIRGTLLGALDAAFGQHSENNEIAARGKMETSQGMAKMRGASTEASAGYEPAGNQATAQGASGVQPRQFGDAGAAGMAGVGAQQKQSDYQHQQGLPGEAYHQGQSGGGEKQGYDAPQQGGYQQSQLGGEYGKGQTGAYQQRHDAQAVQQPAGEYQQGQSGGEYGKGQSDKAYQQAYDSEVKQQR